MVLVRVNAGNGIIAGWAADAVPRVGDTIVLTGRIDRTLVVKKVVWNVYTARGGSAEPSILENVRVDAE